MEPDFLGSRREKLGVPASGSIDPPGQEAYLGQCLRAKYSDKESVSITRTVPETKACVALRVATPTLLPFL